MGGVRSRKYCASISDMTTTWGLGREVVLRINLPRASIEAWWMLWHFSRNGSCGWLRYWGKYVWGQFSSHHKSGNKIWQFKQWYIWTATIPLQIIAIWGAYYLASIPVHIVLLNEGYHYQTLLTRGLVILSQFVTDYLCWFCCYHSAYIYAVLVAGQNLLRRCCKPMHQSSVNMITTDDDNSLSFQCLGSIF